MESWLTLAANPCKPGTFCYAQVHAALTSKTVAEARRKLASDGNPTKGRAMELGWLTKKEFIRSATSCGGYLPVQGRQLLHPYSDAAACAGVIRCQQIEEVLASKLTALLHRYRAADLFDLLYSILFRNEFAVNRLEVITTFLRKSIFEPNPLAAREQLLALPLEEFRPLWPSIVAFISSLIGFDFVVGNFVVLIDLLFSLVQRVLRPGTLGRGAGAGRASAYAVPLSGGVRSAIVTGGRTSTLVEIFYRNARRLVEPYRIQYYVRKSDGLGSEYFLGYDTTGGNSGPGLKTFFCDRIESARATNIPFRPRRPIEL